MRSLTAKNDVLPEQYVGTDRANLSHFWTANNLVKFSTIKKCSRIPEDHALGRSSVKLQLMISSKRGYMIIFLRPIFDWGYNLSDFGLLGLGYTRFLQSFLGFRVKIENMSFCARTYRKNTEKKSKSRSELVTK